MQYVELLVALFGTMYFLKNKRLWDLDYISTGSLFSRHLISDQTTRMRTRTRLSTSFCPTLSPSAILRLSSSSLEIIKTVTHWKDQSWKEIATFLFGETSSLLFDGNILSKMCVNTNCVYQDITEELNLSCERIQGTPLAVFEYYSTVENSFYDCQINSFHSGEKT